MKEVVINIIKGYQYFSKTIIQAKALPLLAPVQCRFYPSCSEYTIESIREFGVLKGVMGGAKRILQCNPLFNKTTN